MGTAVISCCHASPIFKSAKHVLNFMALFIQGFVEVGRKVTALSRRDAGRYSLGEQCGPELVAVIPLVTDQIRSTVRQCGIKQLGSDMVAHLAFTQAHDDRATLAITNCM